MTMLKLGALVDDRPVRLTIELPATIHRDLAAYADVLARETGTKTEPTKLIAPMLARFMASDRAFAKARRAKAHPPGDGDGDGRSAERSVGKECVSTCGYRWWRSVLNNTNRMYEKYKRRDRQEQ